MKKSQPNEYETSHFTHVCRGPATVVLTEKGIESLPLLKLVADLRAKTMWHYTHTNAPDVHELERNSWNSVGHGPWGRVHRERKR